MAEVTQVAHWDMTKNGFPMAGLAVNTRYRQYRFFREGMLAPYRMKETARIICAAYEIATRRSLPVIDYTPSS
jgi:hypothetical protein